MNFSRLCAYGGYSLYGADGCRFLTAAVHSEFLSLGESWAYRGLYAFITGGAEDQAFAAALLKYWRRAGEHLAFLWIQSPDFRGAHAIFARPDTHAVTHTWGLDFSGYGAVLAQGAILGVNGDRFSISGRVGFTGANALLWGEGATLDESGKIEFTVRHKGGFDLAEALDSGIKLSFDHEFESEDIARENGFLLTVTNRVICAESEMPLRISIEPAYKRLEVFFPEDHIFGSNFIGVSGRQVTMKSLGGAHWTLAETAAYKYDGNFLHTRYYLTLAGSFEPQFDGTDRTILPGLTGTEYFDFTGLESPNIEFIPDSPVYLGKANEKSRLPTGAWVRYPKGAGYYSQPSEAPLFAPDGGYGLAFLSVPLLSMNGAVSVPQVFYRETGDLPAQDLEGVVYAERFRILCAGINQRSDANDTELRAVSPQGLMVGVRSEAWSWISLANVGTLSNEKLLRLSDIDLPLRKEFADIDMNLIFDKPERLSSYVQPDSAFAFCLDDIWALDMNPSRWDDSSLLIIKYGTDSTIRELVGESKAFVHALSCTCGPDGKLADEFAGFIKIIDDAKFTGVLALGVKLTVDESKLNNSIKTVWRGIDEADRADMRAHHLIVRHTKVTQIDTAVAQQTASVDTLVCYRAKSGISYGSDYNAKDYDFRTTALTLKVKNSKLELLATESELLINTVAGSPCKKENGNCLIMDGRADSTSGLDGFSFALRDEELYTMPSPLEGAKITGVSLTGESVFSLGGRFYFIHDKQSDLFSFGFDGEKDLGLGFMGWKIRKSESGDFFAEYGDIILLQSEPRVNSWAERFPVGVDAFCHDRLRLPDQCGYVNVKTTLSQKKIAAPWYGVRFRVPLGSLGDLSENSVLDLHIIMAWSGGEDPGLYVGVRLPDALLGGGIDVQGLIKLGFDTIALESRLENERMRFRLSLKQFTARLLWASFPPGKNEIVIEADETGKKLGWLGYYRDKGDGFDGD